MNNRRECGRTVSVTIDLCAGVSADVSNNVATGAENVADLVVRNLEGRNPRCEVTDFFTARCQRCCHLAQDVHAAALGLAECDLQQRDRNDLECWEYRASSLLRNRCKFQCQEVVCTGTDQQIADHGASNFHYTGYSFAALGLSVNNTDATTESFWRATASDLAQVV